MSLHCTVTYSLPEHSMTQTQLWSNVKTSQPKQQYAHDVKTVYAQSKPQAELLVALCVPYSSAVYVNNDISEKYVEPFAFLAGINTWLYYHYSSLDLCVWPCTKH